MERLFRLERLKVRRRKRKKAPVSERQPFARPSSPHEGWSIDIVFDRAAGRALKCLIIVDDSTRESVASEPSLAFSGKHLVRFLRTLCATQGTPRVIRTTTARSLAGGKY